MSSKASKIFTGLPVCTEPHKELLRYYSKILRGLQGLPEESKYRSITEKLIKDREAIVESTTDSQELERRLKEGQCEELIEKAKLELHLINVMKEHKPWEQLEEQPPANQWKWPIWKVEFVRSIYCLVLPQHKDRDDSVNSNQSEKGHK